MVAGFDEKTCEILRKSVPTHQRRGNGGTYSYHKGSDVIRRLNEAFNHGWTSEKIEEKLVDDQVLLLVGITAMTKEGEVVIHHGYGSAAIAKRNNVPLDIGNTYKSAFTNALKKAAEQFGIGLGAEEEDTRSQSKTVTRSVPKPSRTGATSAGHSRSVMSKSSRGNNASAPMRRPEPLAPRTAVNKPTVPRHTQANVVPTMPTPAVSATTQLHAVTDLNAPVSDTQCRALSNLAKMKGKGENELVKGAGVSKGMFSELTKEEAIQVIKYASTL